MRRNIKNNNKKERKGGITTVLVVVGIITVLSSIFMTIKVATSGAKLTMLEKEEKSLIKENETYKRQLVNSSSLSKLENASEDLGYVKPDNIIYIQKDEPVAKLP